MSFLRQLIAALLAVWAVVAVATIWGALRNQTDYDTIIFVLACLWLAATAGIGLAVFRAGARSRIDKD